MLLAWDSPSKKPVSSDWFFLGTRLSTSAGALVDRQYVRVPGAKLCFATGSKKFAPLFFAGRLGLELAR